MTKQQAKDLALEKLRIYAKLPYGIRAVPILPDHLKTQLMPLQNYCPLCNLFCWNPKDNHRCEGCPLTVPFCNQLDDIQLAKNIKLIEDWVV